MPPIIVTSSNNHLTHSHPYGNGAGPADGRGLAGSGWSIVTVVIEVDRLSKRFGPVTAVDDLSFTVRPGHVTGFLGPNGAGKPDTGL